MILTGGVLLIFPTLVLGGLNIIKESVFFNDVFAKLQAAMNFSIKDFLLFLINIGLSIIVFNKENYEDERIERIRSYCFKYSFRFAVVMFMSIGLFMNHFNILLTVVMVQLYYYLLFRLCIYRDSGLVYADVEEQKEYALRNHKKYSRFLFIWSLIIGGLSGMTMGLYPEFYGSLLVISGCVFGVIGTVALHWKSEALSEI